MTFAHAVTDALGDRTPDEIETLGATLDGTVDPDNDTLERWTDADRRTYTPNPHDVLAAQARLTAQRGQAGQAASLPSSASAVARPPVSGDGGAASPAASQAHAAGGVSADTQAETLP